MAMTTRDRRAITWGGGGLAVLLIVYFVLLPWIASWRSARERLDSVRSELTTLRAQTQRLAGRRRRLREAVGPAAQSEPLDLAQARLRAVETIKDALKSAASIRPESARPLRDVPGLVLLTIRVEGKAKLEQITRALATLRRAEQLILIDRLEITREEDGERRGRGGRDGGNLTFSLTLSTPAKENADS